MTEIIIGALIVALLFVCFYMRGESDTNARWQTKVDEARRGLEVKRNG